MSTRRAALLLTGLLAVGCSYPDLHELRSEAAQRHRERLTERTRALLDARTAPLTLAECEAAALANNLDLQLARFETAVAHTRAGLEELAQLPSAGIQGTASWRNGQPYSRSQYLFGGGGIRDAFATGAARDNVFLSAELAWSPLDFGLACYTAQQAQRGAEAMSYAEQRVAQRLVTTVRSAFVRLQAADDAAPLHEHAIEEAETRLRLLEAQRTAGQATPAELAAVISALEDLRGLRVQNDRVRIDARAELAAAMGIDPSARFEVTPVAPVAPELPPLLPLVDDALAHHPELFQADAGVEQARVEVERAWLQRFPNVRLLGSYNYDDNPFLLYDTYTRVAAQLDFDLWQTMFGAGQEVAEAQQSQARADREVASMAITLQVVRAHAELAEGIALAAQAERAAAAAERREREFREQLAAGLRDGQTCREARTKALTARSRALHAWAEAAVRREHLVEATGVEVERAP